MRRKKISPFLLTVLILLLSTVSMAESPQCSHVFKTLKELPFESLIYPKTALHQDIPGSAWEGSLMDRRAKFIQMYAANARVVKDVYFQYSEPGDPTVLQGTRDVLVISLKDAPPNLLDDYLDFISIGTVSFPLGRRGGHLYTRFGTKTYDKYIEFQFDESPYTLASSNRIETVVQLSPSEFSNMALYIANVRADVKKVIGKFSYDGSQNSKGKLEDNLCLVGGHNCTSWIATSGIGQKGKRFLELMGGKMNLEVGTNPGWWSLFLNTRAKKDRVPFTIFWTKSSLTDSLANEVKSFEEIKTEVREEGELVDRPWDFNPH